MLLGRSYAIAVIGTHRELHPDNELQSARLNPDATPSRHQEDICLLVRLFSRAKVLARTQLRCDPASRMAESKGSQPC